MSLNYLVVKNHASVPLASIPELDYSLFFEEIVNGLMQQTANHCVNYFAVKRDEAIVLYCCIANDLTGEIALLSSRVVLSESYRSFTALLPAFEKFEREIHENCGLRYCDHPWLKPVRYPFNRHDASQQIVDYPFYAIQSEELHEVGVGPVHAGIIEPGHFRFICNGEQILHLEIQLGYQHRGIEQMFTGNRSLLQRVLLAESIAGDSVVAHTTAFSSLWESLCGYQADDSEWFYRCLALEWERMAVHTGDLSAMCGDIAYQLGSAVYGRLRTPILNFFQEWCGNRLAKGLIRPGGSNFAFTAPLAERILQVLSLYEPDLNEMSRKLFKLPSALSRFEKTGVLHTSDALSAGIVGVAARMSGVNRDIRASHPYGLYKTFTHEPIVKHHGDVYSRTKIRWQENVQSAGYIRSWVKQLPEPVSAVSLPDNARPDLFAISLVEGWRGEICHCALTNAKGQLVHYKVKDPSFHNWMALALAVRNNEISDFPVCNKSFNLSYAGHDL